MIRNKLLLFSSLLALLVVFSCNYQEQEKNSSPVTRQLSESQYNEKYRPQIHFSPDSMWMNDPNGMVYYDGEYHLFYQYYPEDIVWGPMHWGHAISTDLVRWEHLPIALYPDEHGYIFSGSAVVDHNNTSGLGTEEQPPMVAIFTYHDAEAADKGSIDYQTQGIAYSLDRGRNWTKYDQNPVLPNPGLRDFRDPKVMWYPREEMWIMSLAAGDHIRFYSSPDLIHWDFEGEFGSNAGAHGGVWECPDLFPLMVGSVKKWVLLVSINPGGPFGGSATQYFIGQFNGKTFVNDNSDSAILWLDHGRDNYAGVTYSNIPEKDGRRIFIGWMSNWDYGQEVPTKRWRSAMTIPRTLELKNTEEGIRLFSRPVIELETLRKDTTRLNIGLIPENQNITIPLEIPCEIDLQFTTNGNHPEADSRFGLSLFNAMGEQMTIGFRPAEQEFYTDRRSSSKRVFNEGFESVQYARFNPEDGQIEMRLYIDVSSVELFAGDGEVVMTDLFFPVEEYDSLTFFSQDTEAILQKGILYSLQPIW
ncbi:MAG: glycoside hydrolase family 32 protein [bacterium]